MTTDCYLSSDKYILLYGSFVSSTETILVLKHPSVIPEYKTSSHIGQLASSRSFPPANPIER